MLATGSPSRNNVRARQVAGPVDSVTLGGAPEDLDLLKRNRDLGIARTNVRLPPAKTDEILPLLDLWAKLIPQLRP